MLSCNLVAAVKTAPVIEIIGDGDRGPAYGVANARA